MKMRNHTTPQRGKTLLSTLRAAISQDTDPLTASPRSLVGRAEAFCKEGDALFDLRDWEGASDSYRAAVALAPDHPEARLLLVDALYRRAHARPDVAAYKDETLATCEEALRLAPGCWAAAHYLARTLQDLGRQEEAYRLHETTTLDVLTSCLQALTKPVADEGQRRELSDKLREMNALMTFGFRLFRAYVQESEGAPIGWAGYLSDPIDAPDDSNVEKRDSH